MADQTAIEQRHAAVALALRSATATILCLFVIAWLLSVAMFKLRRVEERWVRVADD